MSEDTLKIYYICQTYIELQNSKDPQAGVKIDKQFQYTTTEEAESRAERAFQLPSCVGADAYIISEDPNSGEISPPTFLVRIGNVPEFDDF